MIREFLFEAVLHGCLTSAALRPGDLTTGTWSEGAIYKSISIMIPQANYGFHRGLSFQLLPVAAAETLSLPATIFLTVARISEKFSNVLKGTISLSQYETRSDAKLAASTIMMRQGQGPTYRVLPWRKAGPFPWRPRGRTRRHRRRTAPASHFQEGRRKAESQATYRDRIHWYSVSADSIGKVSHSNSYLLS